MIVLFPIEPLDERYSTQWLTWFETEFKRKNINWITINPDPLTNKIENGAFLDICGTNYYKASQLMQFIKLMRYKKIGNGDIVFLHDIWFPGLESLAYIRDALNLDIKIVGCLHAGTYDSTDFIAQKGMGVWGKDLENSWFKLVDKVFVGSEYHKKLILRKRKIDEKKLIKTGFPIYWNRSTTTKKENIVLFPNRLSSDKQPYLFNKLAKEFKTSGWSFIKTQELRLTKGKYYDLLEKSKIVVSFSKHENFGIAMREGLFSGCIPVVPNTLCYPEFFNVIFRYCTYKECVHRIADIMNNFEKYETIRMDNSNRLLELGRKSIGNMIQELDI